MTHGQGSDRLVEVANLRIWFPVYRGVNPRHVGDVKAVDGISFDIAQGETLGIVGESGCGKSTLAKGLLRLVPITEGQLWFRNVRGDGSEARVDLAALSRRGMRPLRRDIQMVFQDPYSSLNPRQCVRDIVEEPLRVHEATTSAVERAAKAAALLARMGLRSDQMDRYPHEFSGGQRQRISLARALVTRPKLLVADEPVSALDVSIQAQVINLLLELREEFQLTTLFIAHDLSVVEHVADRVAVMYLGEIVEIGPTEQILGSPRHPYTKALLSAVPRPDPERKRQRLPLTGEVPSPMAKPSGCPSRTRCPIVQPACVTQKPSLVTVETGHLVACPFSVD